MAMIMEIPPLCALPNFLVRRHALVPFQYHNGGTVLVSPCTVLTQYDLGARLFQAAKLALERGWALNVGGGFHHCSSDRGGGFCVYADITLALRFLFYQGLIRTAMIVDYSPEHRVANLSRI